MCDSRFDNPVRKRSASYLSVREAAARLGFDPAEMLAWDMVIVVDRDRVPHWCVDPRVARALPLLARHFRGEALEFCLLNMRPCGDARNGVEALQDGELQAVSDMLADYRTRLEQILRRSRTEEWLDQFRDGALTAPPVT
ncbi:MAG: hypothetical protein RIR62_2297 [Pseudomonadota bacterium]|jgi:hypothetical protein